MISHGRCQVIGWPANCMSGLFRVGVKIERERGSERGVGERGWRGRRRKEREGRERGSKGGRQGEREGEVGAELARGSEGPEVGEGERGSRERGREERGREGGETEGGRIEGEGY